MICRQRVNKAALARQLGISRASLYYVSKQLPKDWALKTRIEALLAEQPSYGSPRVAEALGVNEKRAARVMRLFGLKAYRRRGRKPKKKGVAKTFYPNLLRERPPQHPHDVWVADFTYIPYQGKFLYLATGMDLFTREIVGISVQTNHSASLVLQALFSAAWNHPRPNIHHSDSGREYDAQVYTQTLTELGSAISRSAKGCPWENGYQEAFYSQFKLELGDPNRFKSPGELVYEIYRLVWNYNHKRIHSALKMPPFLFAERYQKLLEKAS